MSRFELVDRPVKIWSIIKPLTQLKHLSEWFGGHSLELFGTLPDCSH